MFIVSICCYNLKKSTETPIALVIDPTQWPVAWTVAIPAILPSVPPRLQRLPSHRMQQCLDTDHVGDTTGASDSIDATEQRWSWSSKVWPGGSWWMHCNWCKGNLGSILYMYSKYIQYIYIYYWIFSIHIYIPWGSKTIVIIGFRQRPFLGTNVHFMFLAQLNSM